jgi:hypothetical protein
MDEEPLGRKTQLIAYGAAVGLVYGLAIRFGSIVFPNNSVLAVMTLGFMVFLPLAMGFISVFIVERRREQPLWIWFLLPWIPVVAGEVATMLAYVEGFICVVMFTPIALAAGSLGGVAAGLIARHTPNRAKKATVTCVVLLPLLAGPLERQFPSQKELRTVESVTDIRATPEVVWRNIERVPRIDAAELQPSWSRRIGFPSPVEATLSREGVGGVRHASFERGVLFVETIDTWEPEHRLGFSIHAETAQIPRTTLDEHVTVGGDYFDVLRGEYRLEPLGDGRIRLHLLSQHRVSTDFNWYAHLWSDAVMADLQKTILRVVRNRCEAGSGTQ